MKKTHQEIKRALAEAERLGRKELAALHRTLDDLLAQPFQVAHAEAVQQVLEVRRQEVLELLDIAGHVQLAALDVFVERGALLHQQRAGNDHRQDRDHQAHHQGGQGRQVAVPAEALLQATLHRRKDDAEDHRPEHCTVERQQYPDKGDGHQGQQ